MRIRSVVRIAAVAAALGLIAPITARAQTILKDNSAPVIVDGITSYLTHFNDIGGMGVSWTLSGGGSGSATWADISAASGTAGRWGVWDTNFKLWGNGSTDTYDNNVWGFWGMDITSFTLSALTGNGVFDLSNPTPGTDNSSDGKTFDWYGTGPASRVTYSNPIAVDPNAFVGDLYGTLKVEFGSYQSSCPVGWTLHNGQCKKWDVYHYIYQNPTQVWQASTFGTDCYCNSNYGPTYQGYVQTGRYSWTYVDNTNCGEKFTQDMDTFVDTPGNPQESVVPEPASMTLLATGLVGMAAAARRRRNRK